MDTEIWKDIPWYEWRYKISNFGNIKSLWNNKSRKDKILKNRLSSDKYLYIQLFNKWKKQVKVGRLVAQAFLWLDINDSKIFVCHKDDNPLNNNVDNLFLWTAKDNYDDMVSKWRKNNFTSWIISRKVNQYSLNWEFIKEWDSLYHARNEFSTLFIWKYKI